MTTGVLGRIAVVALVAGLLGGLHWLRRSRLNEQSPCSVLTIDCSNPYQDMFDDTMTAVYELSVTNASDISVRLASAEAGCECTTIDFSPCWLQPGQTRAIRISYNVASQIGELAPQRVLVSVEDEEGRMASKEATFGGRRRRLIEIEPAMFDFGIVCRGAARRLEGTLTLRGPMRALDIPESQCGDPPQLRFGLIRRASTPDGDLVRFSLTADAHLEGALATSFTMLCQGSPERAIALPIKGEVVSPLELDPPQMFLGIVDRQWRGERIVRLRWRRGDGATPESIEVRDAPHGIVSRSLGPDQLAITIDPTLWAVGPFEHVIRVTAETDGDVAEAALKMGGVVHDPGVSR